MFAFTPDSLFFWFTVVPLCKEEDGSERTNRVLTRGCCKKYILSVCCRRKLLRRVFEPFLLTLHLWRHFMGPLQELNSSLDQ